MKKKKKHNPPASVDKINEAIRRENEIKEYGKILSLRPGKIQESKKTYKRKEKHGNIFETE